MAIKNKENKMIFMIGIDVHCHITHMENPESVVREAMQKLSAIVTVTAEISHAEQALELRSKFPDFVFVSLGLHPEYCMKYSGKEIDSYMKLIRRSRKDVCAIGEVGLDYSWITKSDEQERSKEIFIQMIGLAKELKLPLEIHSRNSDRQKTAIHDTLKILTDEGAKDVVMHCFSGSEAALKAALEHGYYISFATNVCWTKKHPYLAGKTPLEKMLLETDAPWLDPDTTIEDLKNESRKLSNRPWKIGKSAAKIAEIKSISKEEVLRITAENAARFFGLE